LVMPVYRDLFSRYDVTEQQWRVLRVIWTSKNVTSSELSERTLLSTPSLVSIIDRLEKKGLVNRVRSVEDRRQIYVIATANGRALQEEVTPQVAEIQDRILKTVTSEEWQQLQNILGKISNGMNENKFELAANS